MQKLTVNGVQIAFERSGSGAPLVLIHGFPLDHSTWEALLPHLEGADVILPDLRGFGESAVVDGAYTMADMADDVIALLDALKIEKAAFVGHSMGGYVALEIARKHSRRVSGLGLVSTQALPDAPERKAGRYATAEQVGAQGSVVVAEAMAPKLSSNPQHIEALRELILRQSAAGVMGALGAMAERADSTDLLSTFKIPVAIVVGLADVVIPVDRSREMKALIPQASLTEIPNAGHMPMWDAPVETAKALKDGLL
jgi:pimeloyl-ACP methyl ester carboxylesterase